MCEGHAAPAVRSRGYSVIMHMYKNWRGSKSKIMKSAEHVRHPLPNATNSLMVHAKWSNAKPVNHDDLHSHNITDEKHVIFT